MDTYINPHSTAYQGVSSSPNKKLLVLLVIGIFLILASVTLLLFASGGSRQQSDAAPQPDTKQQDSRMESSTFGGESGSVPASTTMPSPIPDGAEDFLRFSSQPVAYTLPGNDALKMDKTLFTSLRSPDGQHEDIEITVEKPENNYNLAVYNGISIVWAAIIRKEDPGTHFHAFDIRPLVSTKEGSVLFYPEDVEIERGMQGKPSGFVYEIPIRIALGQ